MLGPLGFDFIEEVMVEDFGLILLMSYDDTLSSGPPLAVVGLVNTCDFLFSRDCACIVLLPFRDTILMPV